MTTVYLLAMRRCLMQGMSRGRMYIPAVVDDAPRNMRCSTHSFLPFSTWNDQASSRFHVRARTFASTGLESQHAHNDQGNVVRDNISSSNPEMHNGDDDEDEDSSWRSLDESYGTDRRAALDSFYSEHQRRRKPFPSRFDMEAMKLSAYADGELPTSCLAKHLSVKEYISKFSGLPAGARTRTMPVDEMEVYLAEGSSAEGIQQNAIALTGRIHARREAGNGKLYFYDLVQNGHKVQILAERESYGEYDEDKEKDVHADFESVNRLLRKGDIVGVRGYPGKSGRGELSIIPAYIELLTPGLRVIPGKISNPDLRFRRRHLDMLVNPSVCDIFRTRSKVISFLRRYLEDMDFLEVETPVLGTVPGGALAEPFMTHARALDAALYLRIAPELYLKQLVIGGLDRVFEIGRVFRNEGVTPAHNPEFTMCEFYQAYADYEDLMALTEDLLKSMVESLNPGDSDFSLTIPAASVKYSGTPAMKANVSPGVEMERAKEDVEELTRAVSQQGNYVRALKKAGASKDEVKAAVQVLLSLKSMLSGKPSAEEESGQTGKYSKDRKEVVHIDFSPPFQRIPVVGGLEEKLGVTLPKLNFTNADESNQRDKEEQESVRALLDLCSQNDIVCPPPHNIARLLDKLVGHFLEPECIQPTFITGHPKAMSPLAKETQNASEDRLEYYGETDRFELFIGGREICNAYTELNDPDEQRMRFEAQARSREVDGDNEALLSDETFCEALEYGLPPTAGWGMGIDRFVMLMTGHTHIREVLCFPTMKQK